MSCRRAELIEEPEGISRRALYKRMAELGAAAVSAPLIYSVAVRPASAAASPLGCGDCLHRGCNVLWNTADCSGTPRVDGCVLCSGSAGCACQELQPCEQSGTGSLRTGICM